MNRSTALVFCLIVAVNHAVLGPWPPGRAAFAGPGVVINEFVYDDAGTDDREFVELFNGGAVPIDLSGWQVVAADSSGPNPSYTIPPGTILNPGAYYVLGNALVPNVNLVLASNMLENDQESIQLKDPVGFVHDSVVYEASSGTWPGAPAEGTALFGAHVASDTLPTSWSRLRDGEDTNDNARDFRIMPATPGASNNVASLLPQSDTYDATPPDTAAAAWSGTTEPPYVVNPTVLSVRNPKVLPPSPQGGNALVFHAPPIPSTGRAWMLRSDAESLIYFDAFVYFDTPTAAGDSITWTIGLRGTTTSNYATPNPAHTPAVDNNGDTGLAWTYQATSTSRTLWLIDNHTGGREHIVLARISSPPSGWNRLSLNATDGIARGRLNGAEYAGPMHETAGAVYVGMSTTSTSGALMVMQVDDKKIKKGGASIANPGDPACIGNCPTLNATAKTLDTESAIEPGQYAFLINFNGTFQASQLCFYTALREGNLGDSTAAVHSIVSGLPSTNPISVTHGSVTYPMIGNVTTSAHGVGWLGTDNPASQPFCVTGNSFIVLTLTDQIHVPIAKTIAQTSSGSTTPQTTTYYRWDATLSTPDWVLETTELAWAWRWVCDGDGSSQNRWKGSDCLLGTIIESRADNANPMVLPLAIDALSTAEFAPPVSLAVIGLPNCVFYPVSPIFLSAPGISGTFQYFLAVPNNPALNGLTLFSQWAFLAPTTPSGFDISPKASIILR